MGRGKEWFIELYQKAKIFTHFCVFFGKSIAFLLGASADL